MNKTYIMLKDIPVLKIENYQCEILDYDHLPISLRYPDVNFDDVMHGWTENRTMSIGKTNAKKILAGFGIRQRNSYQIAKLFHFASLTDAYWMKEAEETCTWDDVSLFRNPFEKAVSASALFGISQDFPPWTAKIHTPELTTQGMAAKAWIWEADGIYLYKVGKKELAASRILDILQVPHVRYFEIEEDSLKQIAGQEYLDQITASGEKVVKSRLISSEEKAIVPWEDFQVYCSFHEKNEYEYVMETNGEAYARMQAADYILGNDDRHGANWGFFMDLNTGGLMELYPLMDHDHAFSVNPKIPSQTSERKESLEEAAMRSVCVAEWKLERLAAMEKPEELSEAEWEALQCRIRRIQEV